MAAKELVVLGGGLAGSEAAWQAANRGIPVRLHEMRPGKMTPAHKTPQLAELVCSNSLRSDRLENAAGLLKEEMRQAGSLILAMADHHRVPAGSALAVDREIFSREVTRALESHPLISIVREEVTELPSNGVAIVATGPLTSELLANAIREITGRESLYFYDAISPIVEGTSLNPERIFPASRYDKGDDDYLNCPLNEEEYSVFHRELVSARTVSLHEFEKEIHFEGCLPIEVIAKRGRNTMAFGPMKPVGLEDPRTGERPFAVVQLRREDREGTMYNLVGFQTKLTYGEQLRVFRLIPGLEQAVFLRYGSAHRNTFINSPRLLQRTLQLRGRENLFFAGQIVGVEGYVESAAMGLMAGIHAARWVRGLPLLDPPAVTAHGTLLRYISAANPRHFQPMNVNYGLFADLDRKVRDRKSRHAAIASRALHSWKLWLQELEGAEAVP